MEELFVIDKRGADTAHKNKRQKVLDEDEIEARRLTKSLFGDQSESSSVYVADFKESQNESEAELEPPQAAWEDPADRELEVDLLSRPGIKKLRMEQAEEFIDGDQYQRRLTEHKRKMNRQSSDWANVRRSEIVAQSGGFLRQRPGLSADRFSVTRLKEANFRDLPPPKTGPSPCIFSPMFVICSLPFLLVAILALQFHPSRGPLLVATRDSHIRLFQADGVENDLVQRIHCKGFPIQTAFYGRDAREIIITGRFLRLSLTPKEKTLLRFRSGK